MKKLLAVLIIFTICIGSMSTLVSCDKESNNTTDTNTNTVTVDNTSETTSSTTISDTESTSVFETEEETTVAATETETAVVTADSETEPESVDINRLEESKMLLYKPRNSSHVSISAASGIELACRFSISAGSRLIGLYFESCPTWGRNGESGFTIELYKWNRNYNKTISGEPLFTASFTNWIDNHDCDLDFTDIAEYGFPSGSYMYVFRGDTDNIGIWALDPAKGCEYYEYGTEGNNGFRVVARILVPKE